MDCAIVKFVTMGFAVENTDAVVGNRLGECVTVECYCHKNRVEVEAGEVLASLNVAQYFDGSFFQASALIDGNTCAAQVELKEGKNGPYAIFRVIPQPGKSKSANDPFKITVSRWQRVIDFAQKPSVVEVFPIRASA